MHDLEIGITEKEGNNLQHIAEIGWPIFFISNRKKNRNDETNNQVG
jgi:hypothetical protein